MTILALALVLRSPLLEFSVDQWARTPKMEIEDAYKWLYHATQGGDHAVKDESGPRAWMDGEWDRMDMRPPFEPLIDRLTPDGRLVRLNLQPFKAQGGDKEMILALFISSAKGFAPRRAEFVREWNGLGSLLRDKAVRKLTYFDWRRLDSAAKARGYPAWGHSDTYERLYHPHYRVVLSEFLVGGR
jgi:hypothetical protein